MINNESVDLTVKWCTGGRDDSEGRVGEGIAGNCLCLAKVELRFYWNEASLWLSGYMTQIWCWTWDWGGRTNSIIFPLNIKQPALQDVVANQFQYEDYERLGLQKRISRRRLQINLT